MKCASSLAVTLVKYNLYAINLDNLTNIIPDGIMGLVVKIVYDQITKSKDNQGIQWTQTKVQMK